MGIKLAVGHHPSHFSSTSDFHQGPPEPSGAMAQQLPAFVPNSHVREKQRVGHPASVSGEARGKEWDTQLGTQGLLQSFLLQRKETL